MTVFDIPKRLAVILALQVVTCMYCVLGVAAIVKARTGLGGDEEFVQIHWLTVFMKQRGWLLFLLPCAWYFWQVRSWMRRGADWAFLRNVVLTGLAVFFFLVGCGFFGTVGAMRTRLIRGVEARS